LQTRRPLSPVEWRDWRGASGSQGREGRNIHSFPPGEFFDRPEKLLAGGWLLFFFPCGFVRARASAITLNSGSPPPPLALQKRLVLPRRGLRWAGLAAGWRRFRERKKRENKLIFGRADDDERPLFGGKWKKGGVQLRRFPALRSDLIPVEHRSKRSSLLCEHESGRIARQMSDGSRP